MDEIFYVFTIFFMLLGPLKLIATFHGLTRDSDIQFRRAVALRAVLIAWALCMFVALTGANLLSRYRISFDALRIGGGLVLLISALRLIFPAAQPGNLSADGRPPMQVAASPVAIPMIVPPAGVAAVLIFTMLSGEYEGILTAVAISLTIVMALDFLVMYFIDRITKLPGLMLILTALGSVLVFMQLGLAIEMMLRALKHLGVLKT